MPGERLEPAAGIPRAEPRDLTALYEALESSPADAVTLRALADWLEESGMSAGAACLRWLAGQGKAPYRYYHRNKLLFHHETWQEGWWWWATDREKEGWGYPRACVLPHALWERMSHTFNYDPCVFKEYPTVRGAVEAVLQAWPEAGTEAAVVERATLTDYQEADPARGRRLRK